ncbi:MAG: hypothetical protein HQK79_05495 [Desulfobacterales bacterium]|nr:hypothetical protein [Desulfobacterales bacterium]MBF0395348.1 hypothetical protein [Desulfobacterales bacterium]
MKIVDTVKNIINDKRVGFQIDEVMTGEHVFEQGAGPKGTHFFEFRVTWGPEDILSWVNPFGGEFLTQPLEGSVTIGGLCKNAHCNGTLELLYFKERKIRYTFDFSARGKSYHFIGEKVNIWPWNLLFSHTTCFGTLIERDTGVLVSRSVSYFKLWRGPSFVGSFRFV